MGVSCKITKNNGKRGNTEYMKNILSVIIPVYNCEKYLHRCVDSVISQTYSDLEIILIDDGSTDNSMKICREYEKKDFRVHSYHIDNVGIYQARKYGVMRANGNLVTFVDADDWIEKDTYDNLMKIYYKYRPEIIAFTYQINDSQIPRENNLKEGMYHKEQMEKCIIPYMMYDAKIGNRCLNPSISCKIIQKHLYLSLTESVSDRVTWGEDALVTYPAICAANSIYIDNHPYYHYFMHAESSTHSCTYDIIDTLINFQKNLTMLLGMYGKAYDWRFQIDGYMRSFTEMLSMNWFGIHQSAVRYIFPYKLIPCNSHIQIYGAGEVGKSYIVELTQSEYAKVIGWYDKAKYGETFCNNTISAPDTMLNDKADYVVIAVEDAGIAEKIRDEIRKKGIEQDKILWTKPRLRV